MFQEIDAVVLGVSFDSVDRNKKFADKHAFPFLLLSDPTREMAVAYRAARNQRARMAKRISYVVGPDGRIVAAYAKVSVRKHAAQVIADIAAAPVP